MKTIFRHIILLILVSFSFNIKNVALCIPINSYIDNVSPAMNAVSANKSSDIDIVFTQDMNPSTISSANIKVFGYETGLLSCIVNYTQGTKTATINPDQDFKYGEIISITLTDRIKTLSNENITPFVYKFTAQAIGGTGIFFRSSGIGTSDNAVYLKSGDINGDGFIDLLVNNKVYINNGIAHFTFLSQVNENGIPELADFDSDGDLDILIQNGNTVYFFQNNGSGIFTQAYSFSGGIGSYGDLDGDGFLDISYFISVPVIGLIKNNNGILLSDTSYQFSSGCLDNYQDKTLIDEFNNDGMLDVIGVHGSKLSGFLNSLCVDFNQLKNLGGDVFSPDLIYSYYSEDWTIQVLSYDDTKSFDFDNDGFVDIMSPIKKIKNNGNGTYSAEYGLSYGFTYSLVSDFNGDGFIDIVSSPDYFPSILLTNLNNGNGTFTQITANPGRFNSNAAGDFDNDGDIDIAAYKFDNNTPEVSILINDELLPVELSSFTSSVNSNSVTLNWSTSSEENNSGFDIERSIFNGQWSKISFVPGNGTSTTQHNYSFKDRNLNSGKYKYRLKQTDFNGNYKYYNLSNEVNIGIPEKFELSQNYPNPFNPSTIINFQLPLNGFTSLKVYDNSGREIRTLLNEFKNAGYYTLDFDGSSLPSGAYFYRLETGNSIQTKRMVLLK